MFLRNHDELTLEMVTDEERDYMYRSYTRDPEARINLGIRRRLAPLLNNNRRRIELMNGLLFSLPGTPVIYYGDEIGMGDNIYLGDRDGVRTPMQWSGDRNAGFSSANRQRLYLPVITDPEYHYEAINVEAQEANQQSLLHWMKRLIALRKRHPAFGRGSMHFLHPNNRKVLAFVRKHGDEQILVVANLSRFAQFAEIDMRAYEGLVPVELFGRTEFPRIGELPYLVTLGPHAFYWFSLEEARVELSHDGAGPELSLDDGKLEEVLPRYLVGQRWYGAKSRRIKEVQVVDSVEVGEAQMKLVEAIFDQGEPRTYLLPLVKDGGGRVVEALEHASFNNELLEAITNRRRFRGVRGDVQALQTAELSRLRTEGEELAARPADTEQSNNSVIFGERLIMKLYRHLEEGVNPDLEMSRFLTEAGFPNVPAVAGALLYRRDSEHSATLAMLQAYVPNRGDGWIHALEELASGNRSTIDCYADLARLLGQRTAEMHLALAANESNADFAPEPTSMLDARSIYQSIRSMLSPVIEAVRLRLPTLGGPSRDDAAAVLEAEERLHEHLRALLNRPISAKRIRCHGDFHLGQVLFTGGDFYIIDFEGEPGRPLRERRLKRWALKDVAGMLRSFEYAAAASGMDYARDWAKRSGEAFLRGYFDTAAVGSFLPVTQGEQEVLLNAMLIEKALYELRYELDHRPDWVPIPLRGLRELAEK
jgi:maltose alpha-D-glucosyltransferase/alpha-amylase